MHWSSPGIQSNIANLALLLMLVTLWLLMHGYPGLTGDGQIYAFQALSRIHPQFTQDLYLQNTSQDRFTIFSPAYAWLIASFGLDQAGRWLFVVISFWFLAAAWCLARALTPRDAAWLAVAFLLIVAGEYGGSGVFRLSEQFLTARLPAEAVIVTALALHFRSRRALGLLLAIGALFVHPLIALPGVLLLSCLWLPSRASLLGAIGGVLATIGIAIAAAMLPAASRLLTVMDADWLEVVRERSQFLFLQLWSFHDWSVNARPFLYLAFTAAAVPDAKIRKLCAAAALVGAAGLAVALIGGLLGPVAILVQGQAWRWIWVTVFIAALLLPITALQAWRGEKCGPLCAILLVSGWTLSAVDGTVCVSSALLFWLARTRISGRVTPYFRCAAIALGVAIVVWVAIKSWAMLSSSPASGVSSSGAAQIRSMFGLRISAVLGVALLWEWFRRSRTVWAPVALSAVLAALSIYIVPAAFKQSRTFAFAGDGHEFADWTDAIPPSSTVLVAPARDVGGFVWFTLQRPNYLAVDQSAGVVFSRATALEVRRRSQVLLPLMDPDWKMLSGLRAASAAGRHTTQAASRRLTAQSLTLVCTDPLLGFVISPESIGVDHLRHGGAGAWKDWNLYDCRQVRAARGAT
jgi:hypothetical protein